MLLLLAVKTALEHYFNYVEASNLLKQNKEQKQYQEKTSQAKDYKVEDEILNKWMNNAKKQAVDLAKETIEDLKGMTKEGMKAASEKVGSQIPSLLIMAVVFLIIALLIKTCNT